MASTTLTRTPADAPVFPAAEVKRCLREELQKIADEGSNLRPEWEPLLDSKRVVGTVLVLEGLLGFKIPPDKVVRKGGHNSLDEAIDYMLGPLERLWTERNKPKVRK
jgi:hypothetical protein